MYVKNEVLCWAQCCVKCRFLAETIKHIYEGKVYVSLAMRARQIQNKNEADLSYRAKTEIKPFYSFTVLRSIARLILYFRE